MSFADPQTVTISAATTSLPRTSVADDKSEYTSGDGLIQLLASHDYGKRIRRMVRLDTSKLTSDPFRPSRSEERREGRDVRLHGFRPSACRLHRSGSSGCLAGIQHPADGQLEPPHHQAAWRRVLTHIPWVVLSVICLVNLLGWAAFLTGVLTAQYIG